MSDPARPLRRDAAQNRARVLDAATEVFGRHGVEAGVEEIARTAGVGMGTLYRRFPTKQALIDELVGQRRREIVALAEHAGTEPEGTGLEWLIAQVGALQAAQGGCVDRLWDSSDAELGALSRFRELLRALLEQARAAGRVRDDVTPGDITMLFWSMRGIVEITRVEAPGAWRRHLDLLLAGLRATEARPSAHPPLTDDQVSRISAASTRPAAVASGT